MNNEINIANAPCLAANDVINSASVSCLAAKDDEINSANVSGLAENDEMNSASASACPADNDRLAGSPVFPPYARKIYCFLQMPKRIRSEAKVLMSRLANQLLIRIKDALSRDASNWIHWSHICFLRLYRRFSLVQPYGPI